MEIVMKFTWLRQAGLLLKNDDITVMVDPYLSGSITSEGREKGCEAATREKYLEASPDVIVITHTHPDHMDIPTIERLLSSAEKRVTLLVSEGAFARLSDICGGHNLVLFAPHSVWSIGDVTFYSVKAEHSDRSAIGVIIDDDEKTYYSSGDTLYNFDVIDDVLDLVESGVDVAFLPINGVGNNMNAKDAADFAYELGAHCAVPVHYGMFDNIDPGDFDFDDALVVEPFTEYEI